MRAAATLLAAEPGPAALRAIAAAAGFQEPSLSLDEQAREALGLVDGVHEARVAGGRGALRALLLRTTAAPRDVIGSVAARMARRSPHLLWLVIAECESGEQRALATWIADRSSPRVVLLLVERRHVVDSDAETLAAIAAARGESDTMTHARWVELLGREALTRRFYRVLAASVAGAADALPSQIPGDDRHALALLATSRLLFLAFVEAKGWLDGDREFLATRFAGAAGRSGGIHRHVVEPLFFGTLNTRPAARATLAKGFGRIPYLNGGLFTRSPLERRWRQARFPDAALLPIVDELLARFRLTTREQAAGWSEAAIDPEMLGRAFETLMASRERRASGAFYTPQSIVAEATGEALTACLAGAGLNEDVARRVLDGVVVDEASRACAAEALAGLRLVDPACGSGAFLVHALERIADLRGRCGLPGGVAARRRDTLARCIFGVDSNPTAAWLCELRLWLAAVIDEDCADPLAVPPLPNLDHNIRVGDSLAGDAFAGAAVRDGATVEALRLRYARATGRRKTALGRELERTQRRAALRQLDDAIVAATHRRREVLLAARARDLFGMRTPPAVAPLGALRERVRSLRLERRALERGAALPFSWAAAFPDIGARGGFDVVLGNPPWVRLHNIPPRSRERLRREFSVFGAASWDSGAEGAGAGRGFAAQVDLAALFVERATQLVRAGGTVALLLPAKLWRSLAGGGVRRLLLRRAPPRLLDDWSESPAAFDAAVYPSLLVARAATVGPPSVTCTLRRGGEPLRWTVDRARLPLDESDGSPWILAPAPVREGFDLLRERGTPLAASPFGRPRLGIKCGCNEAFVVAEGADVEPGLLRPLLRGETLRPWRAVPAERLVWPHRDDGDPLDALPPLAARHFARHRRALLARADARGARRWWAAFRVHGSLPGAPRVVWTDVGRAPRALHLEADDPTLVLNSCYVARCPSLDDALALTALLNSPLVAAWLALVAEPARGGYRRFLGWTMALLPIPRDWARARAVLAAATRRALDGDPPGPAELLALAARAYRIRPDDVAPLVEWTHR